MSSKEQAADKERRKQVLKASFNSERWSHDVGLSRRQYESKEEYVSHQSAKFSISEKGLRSKEETAYAGFSERFKACPELASKHTVLCLCARIGTEVKALLDLGHFAVGVDLNPGSNNEFVMCGDFHNLVFPSGSVDAVYTNSLDHAFDLERIVGEVTRVLPPGGIFLVDVVAGYDDVVAGNKGAYCAGEYEALHWPNAQAFIELLSSLSGLNLVRVTNLEHIGLPLWTQAVLQKPLV